MWNPSTARALTKAVPVFAALGDLTRLELVGRLIDGEPRSIAQLADGLDLTRQGITKHLRVLQRAGIVKARTVGRESQFTYVRDPVNQARSSLETVSAQWDDALERLRNLCSPDSGSRRKERELELNPWREGKAAL